METIKNIAILPTEIRNANTTNIDQLSSLEFVQIVNKEDQAVIDAIAKAQNDIAAAIDVIVAQLNRGGRLIYGGAGTSGRLGVLDASECPPTYGTPPELVQGLIAGGSSAVFKSIEGAEDDRQAGKEALQEINFSQHDIFVGIAASGRTPWVIGAMQYAKAQQAQVIALTCNPQAPMYEFADICITTEVGAEVITGSTRLKSGSAHKMVLNMLSTGSMVQLGKVFGNLMVDVQATNHKLELRARNIVMQATGVDYDLADKALKACKGHCKTAILSILANISAQEASERLAKNKGLIRQCL